MSAVRTALLSLVAAAALGARLAPALDREDGEPWADLRFSQDSEVDAARTLLDRALVIEAPA